MKNTIHKIACILAITLAVGASANTADEVAPLLIGAETPSVVLANQQGEATALDSVLAGKPSVIIFYMGGWCPFCNVQLSELAAIEGDLNALGYQIIAISPDDPQGLNDVTDKHGLGYQLLSDSEYKAMDAFGVGYDNERRGRLPVPSVFLVDSEKRISFQYVNPNYRYRIPAKLLMAAAEASLPSE